MSVVVWDIETQARIDQMPGLDRRQQIGHLQVSCLSFLELKSDRLLKGPDEALREVEEAKMVTLWRDDNSRGAGPFEPLFAAFDRAEVIASFNGLGFDHIVLEKHVSRRRNETHLLKVLDAFSRIREHTTLWLKLDSLLKANGLAAKTADGLAAIRMWHDGERDDLQEYCEADVRALARLLVQRELLLPGGTTTLPNYIFGLASAIAAKRTSDSLRQKRPREGAAEEPTGTDVSTAAAR